MNKLFFSAVLLVIILLGIAEADRPDVPRVLFNAGRDIAANDVKYFIVGQPMAHDEYFVAILKNSYGITAVRLGCMPGDQEAKDAASYNKEIVFSLEKKYGKDFVAEAEQKAKDRFVQERTP
jgi:hypothetical protein